MSDAEFSIAVESDHAGNTISVKGELDIATAPRLGEEIERRLDSSNVFLDLSAVSFIDSSGICVLLGGARRARETRRQLSLRCSPAVERALSLCGADKALCLE